MQVEGTSFTHAAGMVHTWYWMRMCTVDQQWSNGTAVLAVLCCEAMRKSAKCIDKQSNISSILLVVQLLCLLFCRRFSIIVQDILYWSIYFFFLEKKNLIAWCVSSSFQKTLTLWSAGWRLQLESASILLNTLKCHVVMMQSGCNGRNMIKEEIIKSNQRYRCHFCTPSPQWTWLHIYFNFIGGWSNIASDEGGWAVSSGALSSIHWEMGGAFVLISSDGFSTFYEYDPHSPTPKISISVI